MEKQESKHKRISQDQSLRIVQLEESVQKKCTAVAKLSANLEMVQAALRLAEGRVRELVMTAQSRESVLSSLREEWAEQEQRMRTDHQVSRTVSSTCIEDHLCQDHAQGLLEEIEELLMRNKVLSKEKEEQKAALEEGNRAQIMLKRNIEEVGTLNT